MTIYSTFTEQGGFRVHHHPRRCSDHRLACRFRERQAAQQTVGANISVLSISGTAQETATLVADPAGWSGSPGSYSYMWSRCNRSGNSCSRIVGASGKSYLNGTVTGPGTLR
jgi:hypothetical protein